MLYQKGFSLLELMLALGLSSLLLLGLVQVVTAAGSSVRLQDNHAQLQENERLANSVLSRAIRETGFNPQPWNSTYHSLGLGEATQDAATAHSDRLSVRSWSDLNCFNNLNPARDSAGRPMFYIRESTFDLNSQKNLTHQCRYGPSLSKMDTQIRREGLVAGVEVLQLLFGEDSDENGSVNSWVRAGRWNNAANLLGVRVGLLISSDDSVLEPATQEFRVLDSTVRKRPDGKMRHLLQFAVSFRGRGG